MNRDTLADYLVRDCPADTLDAHCRLAAAIRRGDSLSDVLARPELDSLPKTYRYLRDHFPVVEIRGADVATLSILLQRQAD